MFPIKICHLSNEEVSIFKNNYAKNNKFIFEGVWFRSQNEINKENSLWIDETSNRRRTIHFRHTFTIKDNNLVMQSSYLYLSTRLEIEDYEKYIDRIYRGLKNNNYCLDNNIYKKEDLNVEIKEYLYHPKENYIPGYKTVDILVYSNDIKNFDKYYEQVWKLQVKGIREKDKRGNPIYIKNIEELKPFLPAQIELGCGPSIDAGINPLYHLHEIYKVQRHSDSRFYFSKDDDLIEQILEKGKNKYLEFAEIIKNCLKAKPTEFHRMLKKMYAKNIFVGTLLNNNFDHLASILKIDEKTLRVYHIEDYFPKIDFDSRAKSLICIGSHADRRLVQKQARAKGLKIIYVDPEGFETKDGFEKYLIEGATEEDFILNLKSLEFAEELKKL